MQALRAIGGSSLTDPGIAMEHGNFWREKVPSTYVPFRNAHLLAACVSWAEVLGAQNIFVGFVEHDSSGYPDCSESFVRAFEAAANIGTRPETSIRINAPLIYMTKAEIVKVGISLNAPLHLTWSCYRTETVACGLCDSCLLRLRGFRQAGHKDPICYIDREKHPEGTT